MNLYNIVFGHYGPKDSEFGSKCFLLAENDEQVYEWIAAEPKLDTENISFINSWKSYEDVTTDLYNDDYEKIGEETFKEKTIRLKGEMNDDDYDFSDAYYGITLYGWELLKENVVTDYSELEQAGVLYRVT